MTATPTPAGGQVQQQEITPTRQKTKAWIPLVISIVIVIAAIVSYELHSKKKKHVIKRK